jgi:hypothetical protein
VFDGMQEQGCHGYGSWCLFHSRWLFLLS